MTANLVVFIFTMISAAIPPLQTQPAGPEITFTATSANVNDAGRAVKINILHWSTDQERDAFVAAMNPPPPAPAPAAGERGRGGAGGGAAGRGAAAGGRGGRGDRGAPPAPLTPIASLTAAIEKAQTIGYLWLNDSNIGYAIRYAYRIPMPNGGERIILAFNRRLGDNGTSWIPVAPATATDYQFTLIELRLNSKKLGEGKASINTKVVVDGEAKTIALDNYTTAPIVLKNLKR